MGARDEMLNVAGDMLSERSCQTIAKMLDEIDNLRTEVAMTTHRLLLLDDVAHRTWHLMDDSGESPDFDEIMHSKLDHERVSAALDALEADGWTCCTETIG